MTSLLDRAVGYTLGSLDLVTPAALTHPTPCHDWNLHALLQHLDDSFAALHEAHTTSRITFEGPIGPQMAPTQDSVAIADRSLSRTVVDAVGALEITVHGWDVAWACGMDRPIPAPLAGELLVLAAEVVAAEDRPGRFAAPVEPGVDAAPGERLVAFLGRRSVGHTAVPHPRP